MEILFLDHGQRQRGKKVNKSVTCSQLLSALHSHWSHPSGGFQKVYYKWITKFVPRSPNRLIYLPEKVKEIILLLFIRCLVFLGYKSQLSVCSISSRATSKLSLKSYSAAVSVKKKNSYTGSPPSWRTYNKNNHSCTASGGTFYSASLRSDTLAFWESSTAFGSSFNVSPGCKSFWAF